MTAHARGWLSSRDVGEQPFWPSVAVISAAALYADLPTKFIAGSSAGAFAAVRWIVPGLTLLLLAVLVITVPEGRVMHALDWSHVRQRVTRRWLTLAMIAVVSAANATSILLLVHLLIHGAHAQAANLLRAALHMWTVNVLLFALWFWQLDGGGPLNRHATEPLQRDFLFPQQTEPALSGWRPLFLDYLYLSFTNATAFSPTDAMPLSRWAKMLMLVESAISLTLGVMVVARAINILQ